MLLKRVLKHKTSFICYFEFHDLYLFTFSRLKSLPCTSSTRFAGQLAHVIGPLKCYNDDYQCYDTNAIRVLPSYPRFTLSSAFYPHIRVLPSHPRFTLIFAFTLSSAFYPLIRVLLSYPCFTLSSVRPYPRFTLTPSSGVFFVNKIAFPFVDFKINVINNGNCTEWSAILV